LKQQVKIILITPSPDQRENILDQNNRLVINAIQVESLSKEFKIGLANVLPLFKQISQKKGTLIEVMSHVNHPNRLGHEIIANEIFKWF
jgi:acyl-CoA thioesterase-1